MKFFTAAVLSLYIFSTVEAATSLKVEGNCGGKLGDGTEVSFTYYSNFDGCKKVSDAGISFQGMIESMNTGTRSFTDSSDIYNVKNYKLVFKNSTGNTSGQFTYKDESTGKTQTVTLQCEVRDYEYSDC